MPETCSKTCGTCACRKQDPIYGHMYCSEFYSDNFGDARRYEDVACDKYIAVPATTKRGRKKNDRS